MEIDRRGKRYRVVDDDCRFFKKGDIVVALLDVDLLDGCVSLFTKEENYKIFGMNIAKYDINTNLHPLRRTEIEEIVEEKNVMENYIVINGKKAELTEEQLKALGIEVKYNPFNVKDGECAYVISGKFEVTNMEIWYRSDENTYCPCKDKSLVEKRAKQEHLSRLLWKFANENNAVPTEEEIHNVDMAKWFIRNNDGKYVLDYFWNVYVVGAQLFKTKEICQRAIEEIVIPFERGDFD